jgi:hypothetical protein
LIGLAEHTGGAFIANTNNLTDGLRAISSDLHSHYELSYRASNPVYDGSFRKIEVRAKKLEYVLRTREGYYAFPPGMGADSPFELPLLTALEGKSPINQLPVRSSSMLFPSREGRCHVVAYLEVPLESFHFRQVPSGKLYQGMVQILVVLRNSSGQPVEKVSQEVPLEGPSDQLENVRSRNFIFLRGFDLEPGRYTLEMAVHDPTSGRMAIKRSVMMVPEHSPAIPTLSSVVLVKRLDQVANGLPLTDLPLRLNQQRVIPYLDPVVNLGDWGELGFYFIVVPVLAAGDASSPNPAQYNLVVSRSGVPVSQLGESPLPEPDQEGQIRFLARLPIANFSPGSYDVTVLVRQGKVVVQRGCTFQVQ